MGEGTNWWDIITGVGEDGSVQYNTTLMKEYTESQIEAAFAIADTSGMTEEEAAAFYRLKDAMIAAVDASEDLNEATQKALTPMEQFSNSLSSLSSVHGFLQDLQDGEKDMVSMLTQAQKIAEDMGEGTNWWDIITGVGEDGNVQYNTTLMKEYTKSQIEAAFAMIDTTGMADGEVQALNNLKNAMLDAADAGKQASNAQASLSERISNAISTVQSGTSLIQSISDELSDTGHNSLDTVKDYIEAVGEGFDRQNDLIIDANGNINLTDSAVQKLHNTYDKLIDDLVDDPVLAKTLKDRIKATREEEDAVKKLSDAYKNLDSARSGHQDLDESMELTYQAYEDLIAIDKRYAEAVDYGSGRLTLNAQKYDEVTQAIMKETQAQAALGLQQLLANERYRDLLSRKESLEGADLQELRDLNAKAMGYAVLINEIQNATSAYGEFMNAQKNVNATDYDAVVSALQVIDDTLNNAESKMYGMIGRDQFKKALKFAIGIEYDEKDFDKTFKRIQGYFSNGVEGVQSFIDDMLAKGLINKEGTLDASLEDIASQMGMTVEGVAAMLNQYNQYADDVHKIDFQPVDATAVTDPMQDLLSQMQEVQTAMDNIQTNGLTIETNPAVQAINTVITTLDSLIKKLAQVSGTSVDISMNVKQNTSTNGGSTSSTSGGIFNWLGGLFGRSSAGGTPRAAGGRTLVGELGPETVVDPHSGRWYTVGNRGAEFVTLPKDAIVFNHLQTKQLMTAGSTGRGNAMAEGNAMAGGFIDLLAKGVDTLAKGAGEVAKGIGTAAASFGKAVGDLFSGGTGARGQVDLDVGKGNKGKGGGGGGKKSLAQIIEELKKKYDELDKEMEHLIRHQEHLYKVAEKGLDYQGMDASLTEQIRLYKKKMEEAQKTVQEMLAAGATDMTEELQEVEESYWSAYDTLYEKLDELNKLYVEGLNDKIDGLQGAYQTLHKALDEFSESGGISIDTFQQLLDQGAEYLTFLEKQDGHYVIQEDKLQDLIAAEKEQLAVEQALAYLGRIKQALADGDLNLLASLVDKTQEIGQGTWSIVDAQLAALQTAGVSAQQYESIRHTIEMIKELAGQVTAETADGGEKLTEVIDDLIDRTMDLIKYEVDKRIEGIKEEIEQYKKIVDLKKESLKVTKEEDDYQKSVSEKVEQIIKLQTQIDQMSLDDSREARVRIAQLREEMVKAQEDLDDIQFDHAYDAQVEALDKMAEKYEESRQSEIEELEESISSREKLYQLALTRIETGWDTLFSDLIAWNTAEGNSLNSEIVETWEAAAAAVAKYGSYVEALAHYKELTGTHLRTVTVPQFHSGGTVGSGNLNSEETLAVLRKGELVLDEKAKHGLYALMDFPAYIAQKVGVAIDKIKGFFLPAVNPSANARKTNLPAMATANSGGNTFNATFNVELHHNGSMTDRDATNYGKAIADRALSELNSAFSRSGIGRNAANRRLGA